MKKTPELRFAGFDDEWTEQKLNEYLEPSKIKNFDNKYTKKDVLSVSGEFGIVNQIEFQGRSFAGEFVDNYGVVDTGDIVYTKSPLNSNPYGIIKYNPGKPGIVSTLYAVYKTKAANPSFVQTYFDLDKRLNDYLRPLVRKGAKNDMKVSSSDALLGKVIFPTVIEQQKIGIMLSKVDSLIELKTKKLESLKSVKKSLLQKCFPKDGCKVPEMRFKGFTGDWKEKKVGEIAGYYYGGGTPKTSIEEYWNGNIPWIQSSDIKQDEFFDVKPKNFITKGAVKNSATKIIPARAIAVVTRVGVGKIALIEEDFTTSQDFLSFSQIKIQETFALYALYKLLQTEQNEVQGTAIKGITKDDLLNKTIVIPSDTVEQQKIGQFFSKYDTLISLQQKEIDKLKIIKKSLLQKMFV